MAKIKSKDKLKKLNFINRDRNRRIEPMTQNDKYLLKAIQKQKSIEKQNENISRFTRGSLRS